MDFELCSIKKLSEGKRFARIRIGFDNPEDPLLVAEKLAQGITEIIRNSISPYPNYEFKGANRQNPYSKFCINSQPNNGDIWSNQAKIKISLPFLDVEPLKEAYSHFTLDSLAKECEYNLVVPRSSIISPNDSFESICENLKKNGPSNLQSGSEFYDVFRERYNFFDNAKLTLPGGIENRYLVVVSKGTNTKNNGVIINHGIVSECDERSVKLSKEVYVPGEPLYHSINLDQIISVFGKGLFPVYSREKWNSTS